jgi:Phage integrase family.
MGVYSRTAKRLAVQSVNVCQQQCKVTGEVKPHGKTAAAIRRVDLHSDLGLLLTDYIGSRKDGFLFHTPFGRMLSPSNISRDSLAGILQEIGYTDTSPFHAFRRFRESRLIRAGAHPVLIDYRMGHEGKDMAALYGEQLTGVDLEDVKWRQEWAEESKPRIHLAGVGWTNRTNSA